MGTQVSRLEEIRHELGLSKADFAALMGIQPNYYTHISKENGKGNLRLEHLESLLLNRGVNPAWIMTGRGEKFLEEEKQHNEWLANHLIPDIEIVGKQKSDIVNYLIGKVIQQVGIPILSSDLAYAVCVRMCRHYIDKNPHATPDNLDIPALTSAFLVLLQTTQALVDQAFEMEDKVVIRFDGREYTFVRQGQPDK